MDMFRPIPCCSAGASFLLQGFFLCSILLILGPQRLRSWSSHIWIGNSLRWTRIFMWCNVLLRIERCDPIPKILCSSVKSTWISLALYPEIRKPKVLSSSIKHSILSTTFLRIFAGLPVSLSMSEQALIAEFASRFSFVTLRYGRIPTITRRLRTISFEVILAQFLTFLSGWTTSPGSVSCWRSSSVILCRRSWSRRGRLCFLFALIVFVAETAGVSSWTPSCCFPLIAFSHFPLNADALPFYFWPILLSQSFDSWSWSFLCWTLTDVSSYHCLQLLTARRRSMLIKFSFIHCQILPEAAQTHEFASCTHLPKHHLWAFHLWTLEVDPISCQNPECRRLVKSHKKICKIETKASWAPVTRKCSLIMEAICLRRRNLSWVWAFCSSRLSPPVEERFRDYPFQSRRSLRIKHPQKYGNTSPPNDCDVLRWSTDLATSTSLIHNIAWVRFPEQGHTSVLNFVFQHWNQEVSGIYRNASLKFDSWAIQSYNFKDKFVLREREDSKFNTSWQILVSVLHDSEGLFPTHQLAEQFFLYPGVQIRKKLTPHSWNFQRMLVMVHLEQVDLQKRVLLSGIAESCSQFQDHKILLYHSRNFTLSCSSWIWTISWFTVNLLSCSWVETSSTLKCLALSASAQPNSS